jgi:hypothetical protein
MPDHTLKPSRLEPFAQDALDARISRALETPPQLSIPADFAAKLARQLPQLALTPAVMVTPARHGRNAAIVSMLVLLVLIFSFAPRVTGNSHLWLSMELVYCAQLVLLALWLGTRHARPFS